MRDKIKDIIVSTIDRDAINGHEVADKILHLFSVKSSVIIEKERQRIWTELCKEVDEDRLTDDFIGSSDDVYDVIFNGKELE
tara:strand:- start:1093 stop:1338 length:246 start_codon:yes stop_codon:yes gene_type:complete